MNKDAIKRVFQKCDDSGDGALNSKEIYKLCKLICDNANADDVIEYLKLNDRDGDEKISFDEFYRGFCTKDIKKVSKAEIQKKFKEFDRDGSGRIDAAELEVLLSQCEGFNASTVSKEIARFDKDGDGKVDFNEFMAYLQK